MSKTLLQHLIKNEEFDCSAHLCHGLQWPPSDCEVIAEDVTSSDSMAERFDRQVNEEVDPLSTVCCSTVHKEKIRSSKEECSGLYLNEHYYESEYQTLLQWIDNEEIIVPTSSHFADKREEIERFSLLADDALSKESYGIDQPLYNPNVQRLSCEVLVKEVAIEVIETPPRGISSGGLQSFIEEQLEGFGEPEFQKIQKDGVFRKRRLCRHFAKGFCVRGNLCDFLHDSSIFCSDDQKVFLGGLPLHLTPELLKHKLQHQGLTVLNKPRIMRGFTPQVCLGSVEEAEKLISQRYIFIGDHRVDIRPYQDKDQLRQEFPSVIKRSVFLGGLPEATTVVMIVNDLRRLDIKVVDCPVIKNGYAPRVVLETLEQAKMLVKLKRIMVNGTAVDVRPYINFRKRY